MKLPIPYGRQEITEDDIQKVTEVLQGDFLTQGPAIGTFEKAFATYVQAPYATAVSNGTAALHLGVQALGVDEGSTVVTTPLTFAASANCVLYNNAKVTFCDIDPSTGLMDLSQLAELVDNQKDIKGIIPVDFAGFPIDTEKMRAIVGHERWILEDACHAPGGWLQDSEGKEILAGSCQYTDAAIFSFHPVKHIAAGEGGMVTTHAKDLALKIKQLRTHGITKDPNRLLENHGGWYHEMHELGFNYRLTDIQAALGQSQLTRAAANFKKRIAIASRYDDELKNLPIQLPSKPSNGQHAYHLYVIRTGRRKELYDYLHAQQIRVQVHYLPVHLHPYYQSLGFTKGQYPQAESYYSECLSIPMFPTFSESQQGYVIDRIKAFFE